MAPHGSTRHLEVDRKDYAVVVLGAFPSGLLSRVWSRLTRASPSDWDHRSTGEIMFSFEFWFCPQHGVCRPENIAFVMMYGRSMLTWIQLKLGLYK